MKFGGIFTSRSSKLIVTFCISLFPILFLIIFAKGKGILLEIQNIGNDIPRRVTFPLSISPSPDRKNFTISFADSVITENTPLINGNYLLQVTESQRIPGSFLIQLEDLDANRLIPYAEIRHVVRHKPISYEVRNGNLYIFRQDSYEDGSIIPSQSLWRYDSNGNGERIIEMSSREFSVSPLGNKVAFFDPLSRELSVYDLVKKIKQFQISINDPFFVNNYAEGSNKNWDPEFLKWDNWESVLWGTFTENGTSTGVLFSIKPFISGSDRVKIFYQPEIKGIYRGEMDISSVFPYLVYSDYDKTDPKDPVKLYALNLETKTKKQLETNRRHNFFRPYFVDINTVSVMDDVNGGRKRIKINL